MYKKHMNCWFHEDLMRARQAGEHLTTSLHDCDVFHSLRQHPSTTHQHTGAKMSVKRRRHYE